MPASVLVTGIGGNVGQGVLRILRAIDLDLTLIGTNTRELSAGNHLCDIVHCVPPAVDPSYPAALRRLCAEHGVALVIPCTDDESVQAGRAMAGAVPVAGSDPETSEVFFDKLETARALAAAKVPFAPACLPSEYAGQFDNLIVKPRTGRGSRDIARNPPDPRAFDDSYLVQRLIAGSEITSGFYVRPDGALHGVISFDRELDATGTTVRCHVTHAHDGAVLDILQSLLRAFPIRGCCNVQSIVASDGSVWPFEVNCRVSGTASIRHALGFRDVEWMVRELLLGEPPPSVAPIRKGTALRMLVDVVYPDRRPEDVQGCDTPHQVF